VSLSAPVTVTFSEAMTAGTITTSTVVLRNPANSVVVASVTYNAGTNTATLTPSAALTDSSIYTATVAGGSNGVKDLAGNALASDAVWSFTTVDTTAPTIAARTPASGATGVNLSAPVTVTFSEAMTVATITTSTVVLRNPANSVVPATVTYNAGTKTATLTPTAALTDSSIYTATVVGGNSGVKDLAGIALVSDAVWSFTTVDTTPPTITARTPASGATAVSPSTSITVAFSEAMSVATITTSTVVLRNPANSVVTATVSYNSNTNVATLAPAATLSEATTYTATVVGGSSGVKDVAGNPLIADAVWSFTTADLTAPSITARTPASGATSVSPATTVTVTFSEAMTAATITTSTVALRNPANNLIAATVSYNASTHMATLTPSAALSEVTTYTATVTGGASGVKDVAGNPLTANAVWSFTTADSTAPTITARIPANGATGVSPSTTVTVTFSEAMTAATITASTVVLRNPANSVVPATVSYNASTHVVTLTPSTGLSPQTTYTATVLGGAGGVKDLAGNPLASDAVWTFATSEIIPPTVTAVTPTTGAAGVAKTSVVQATFSQPMDATTITATTVDLRDPSNTVVPATVSYDAGTLTATLQPGGPLLPAALYTFRVRGGASGVKDVVGSPVFSDVSTTFTTAGAPVVGIFAKGRYGDDSADYATTNPVTTRAATNLVAFVHGEGGNSAFPTLTDTYGNTWTPLQVRQTSSWPAFLWVFTAFNAHGGAGHTITATKPNGYPTALVVEVLGSGVNVAASGLGIDDVQ
jgi:hypothetical protein